MALGLTFEQLVAVWRESIDRYAKEFGVEAYTAELGINPTTKRLLDGFRQAYPDRTDAQIQSMVLFIAPFFDAIVKNNETIAKSLSK